MTTRTTAPAGVRTSRLDWRRPSLWIVIVVLAAFLVWWFGFRSGDGTAAPAVTTTQQLVTVTRSDLSNTVSAVGTVAAAKTDNLSFTAPGTVSVVSVQAGDAVTTGQVLATLDSASLQAAVTTAGSTLATAQAKLTDDSANGASSAQVAADQASVQSALDALTNAQQTLAGSQLVATFDGTVASVSLSAGQQLGSGGTGATSATGTGSGSGRSSSSLGSGGGGGATVGASASSSTPQIQVVSRGSFTVSLPVSANDIGNVAVGQNVTLTVTTASANRSGGFGGFGGFGAGGGTTGGGTSTGATAKGTVTSVAKVATASSGVAQYPVVVTFTDKSNGVFIGATVSGAIAVSTIPNVIQVPTRAVTTANGTSTVTVATKGTLTGPQQVRKVVTGAVANGLVQITQGLKEGEQVVVETVQLPTTTLANGVNGGVNAGGSQFGGANGFGNRGAGQAGTRAGG